MKTFDRIATVSPRFLRWFPLCLSLVGCGGSEEPATTGDDAPRNSGQGGEAPSGPECTRGSCDDGKFCNGEEQCNPQSAEADGDGCVAGEPPCGEDGLCSEGSATCVDECPDNDKDGHAEESCGGDDCNDFDQQRFPGNHELCDASHDEDCDPNTLGDDEDGDGYAPVECCNPDGHGGLNCGVDCNDESMEVNPEATEVCNGLDDDCDGIVDNGMLIPFYPDTDGDGYGDESDQGILACVSPPKYSPFPTDCNDGEPASNPRNAETCDGLDNDCNGLLDAADEDDDGDGFADSCAGLEEAETDCDDEVPSTYPGAIELCNGVDDDCDGAPAAGDDSDGDGHAAEDAACVGGPLPIDDCDDLVSTTYPGAPELCNGVDDDCNTIPDDPGAICDVANADATCNEGVCDLTDCHGAFLDCDMLASTGCEEDSTSSVTACGDCSTQCTGDEHCKNSVCTKDFRWVFQSPEQIRGTVIAESGGAFLLGGYSGISVTFGGVTATPCAGACPSGAYATYLDETGTPIWVRALAGLQNTELGSGAVHSSGDLIASGEFATDGMNITGTPFYNRGAGDAFVVRLDKDNGAPLWSREFGGTNSEYVRDLLVIGDEIYVLVGTESKVFRAGSQGVVKQSEWPNFWHALVKLNATDGTILWAKGVGADVTSLAELDGDLVLAGTFWAETFTLDGFTLSGNDCQQICNTPPCYTFCREDIFLARLTPAGVSSWARSYRGTGQESVTGVESRGGNILLTTRFTGNLAGETFPPDQHGNGESIAALFSGDDGAPLWARHPPAGFSSLSQAVPGDGTDWLLLYYDEGPASFGGTPFPDPLESADIVVAQMTDDGTEGWSFHIGGGHTWNYVNGSLNASGDRALFFGSFYWDSLAVGGQTLVGTQNTSDFFVVSLERN